MSNNIKEILTSYFASEILICTLPTIDGLNINVPNNRYLALMIKTIEFFNENEKILDKDYHIYFLFPTKARVTLRWDEVTISLGEKKITFDSEQH